MESRNGKCDGCGEKNGMNVLCSNNKYLCCDCGSDDNINGLNDKRKENVGGLDRRAPSVMGVLQATTEEFLTSLEYEMWCCGECAFFKPEDTPSVKKVDAVLFPVEGECHRRAPVTFESLCGGVARWPAVVSDERCGESVPSKETIKKRIADIKAEATGSPCGDDSGCVDSNSPPPAAPSEPGTDTPDPAA